MAQRVPKSWTQVKRYSLGWITDLNILFKVIKIIKKELKIKI